MIDKRIQILVHAFMLFLSIKQSVGIIHVLQINYLFEKIFIISLMILIGAVLSRVIIRTLEIPIYHDKYCRERRKRQRGYDREYERNKRLNKDSDWYVGINDKEEK
jgi:hypothetical protein